MRPPVAVVVTILVHAVWLPAAIFNVVTYTAKSRPFDAGAAAFAAFCSVVGLYGLLRRRTWARILVAGYLGFIAFIGWAVLIILAVQQHGFHVWPGYALCTLFGWLAIALVVGGGSKRYFARVEPETGTPDAAT